MPWVRTKNDINKDNKGLPDELLKSLVVRLQALEQMSSEPDHIKRSIRAVENCMKRRTMIGGGEKVLAKINAANAFKMAPTVDTDAPGVGGDAVLSGSLLARMRGDASGGNDGAA
jgi:hypothetical protein